jgi:hypothetical protein
MVLDERTPAAGGVGAAQLSVGVGVALPWSRLSGSLDMCLLLWVGM